MNSARRHRVVDWELKNEEKREALEENNAEFRVREEEEEEEEELIEFEDQTVSGNKEVVNESYELIELGKREENEGDWDKEIAKTKKKKQNNKLEDDHFCKYVSNIRNYT